jgi:nucleotide-binding universal stress UspA family protein
VYTLITVPLDGRKFSEQALPLAVSIARKADCPIQLVRVAQPPALGTELSGAVVLESREMQEIRSSMMRDLRTVAEKVGKSSGLAVTPVVLSGTLPDTLARHIEESSSDLVVMTTHDRGRLERLLLDSVAGSVVRKLRLPVLLVRPGDQPAAPDRPSSIRRMLIPLDGSEFATRIVSHATKFALLMQCEVTLVTVVTSAAIAPPTPTELVDVPVVAAQDFREAVASTAAALERVAEQMRLSGLTVRTKVLIDHDAGRAIAGHAAEHSVDVIAMTTHGHGAVYRLVAGSVAEQVLHRSAAAVLMYRPHGVAA